MSCEQRHLDGAYVLGALSPAERQDFERHLADCAECAAAVRELAGLPGLLARVDAEVLDEPPDSEPAPPELLPSLVGEVRRRQRRTTMTRLAVAAVAAGVLGIGPVAAYDAWGPDEPGQAVTAQAPSTTSGTPSSTPPGQAMTALGTAPVHASVALSSVPWGTRLALTCSYDAVPAGGGGGYGTPEVGSATYSLVVHTRDGHTERVATWHSLPGRTMHLEAATAATRDQIDSVVMHAADGTAVLELDL